MENNVDKTACCWCEGKGITLNIVTGSFNSCIFCNGLGKVIKSNEKITLEDLIEFGKLPLTYEKPELHFCGRCCKYMEQPDCFIMGFPFCKTCYNKEMELLKEFEKDK